MQYRGIGQTIEFPPPKLNRHHCHKFIGIRHFHQFWLNQDFKIAAIHT
jgi:hypothetical protein